MTIETIAADALDDLTARIFVRRGMAPADAARLAEVLVWADLSGHGSHGVARVVRYLAFAERGDLDLGATPELVLRTGAIRHWNGQGAAGAVALCAALPDTLDCAREHGLALTLVTGTTHIGAAGYYAHALARAGMIGIVMAASGPLMSYHGTAGPAVSTAPLAIAAPTAGGEPIILDMASSVAALGKLRQAADEGRSIPPDWALDARGRPTADPGEAETVRPMAGPKGSGLALMIEIIASVLPAAPILAAALAPEAPRRHRQNAALISIDVAKLQPQTDFAAAVAGLAATLKAQPREEGVETIMMPGERAAASRALRRRDGIPLATNLLERLRQLAG